jgi:murein DD-endopeptidase MepM/ murein hydrolase activator NlpD
MQGPQSTDDLVALLRQASARLHESFGRAFLDVAGPFPLAGPAHWSNDWHAYRPCPYPHVHEGLDLIAARGTPIVAVASGTITEVVNDPRMAGLGVGLTAANGVRYFYAHMDHFAATAQVGRRVRRGEILGFVGNTGDAVGGVTHLHFEVRPGGVPVPPKPYVDRWLLEAEARARRLVQDPSRARATISEPRLPRELWASVGALPSTRSIVPEPSPGNVRHEATPRTGIAAPRSSERPGLNLWSWPFLLVAGMVVSCLLGVVTMGVRRRRRRASTSLDILRACGVNLYRLVRTPPAPHPASHAETVPTPARPDLGTGPELVEASSQH